jgi:PKD repeat protein
VAAVGYGEAFSYQITASNTPVSFGATGLPAGLFVNPLTGEITGSAGAAGDFAVTISASNAGGTDVEVLTISIAAAALTVTADDKVKLDGQPVPALTVTYVGFVNGDDAGDLLTPPVPSTSATDISLAGQYPITVSGATAANYVITHIAGTLTVETAEKSTWLESVFTPAELADVTFIGNNTDIDNDGVPLLIEYAFDLDPHENSSAALPEPEVDGPMLELSFPALRADLAYTVEVSFDLVTWTTAGVVLENNGGVISASFDTTSLPGAFLRIVVAVAP